MDKELRTSKKVLEAERTQQRMVIANLESMIAEDDSARAVWAFVERLDLTALYGTIVSVKGQSGRPAIDPRVLLALWIQATLDGVGSARELDRLCTVHLRYMWICGGLTPGYHTLSTFRSSTAEVLSALLTDTVAVLLSEGLVDMSRVAQDGVRVRAAAGAKSFRRGKRLEQMRQLAQEQVERLAKEVDAENGGSQTRGRAAQQRAARERAARIERALAELPEVEKRKKSKNGKAKTEARISTTDAESRVMKMADGGFRPAYNVQFATAVGSNVIVGVEVNNQGTDAGMMTPMAEQVEQRHHALPATWLADGGYSSLDDLESMDQRGCETIVPPRECSRSKYEPTELRPTDSPGIARWRTRMATEQAKVTYRLRGSTAELINAQARARGMTQFLVRGIEKVRAVVLMLALTHNMTRLWALQTA